MVSDGTATEEKLDPQEGIPHGLNLALDLFLAAFAQERSNKQVQSRHKANTKNRIDQPWICRQLQDMFPVDYCQKRGNRVPELRPSVHGGVNGQGRRAGAEVPRAAQGGSPTRSVGDTGKTR